MTAQAIVDEIYEGTPQWRRRQKIFDTPRTSSAIFTYPLKIVQGMAAFDLTIASPDHVEAARSRWVAYIDTFTDWYGVGGEVMTFGGPDSFSWAMSVDGDIRIGMTRATMNLGSLISVALMLPGQYAFINVQTLVLDPLRVMELARHGGSPGVEPDPEAVPERPDPRFPWLP
jgi:hypothetical protein